MQHMTCRRVYAQRFNVRVELTEAAELIDSRRPDLQIATGTPPDVRDYRKAS